ncbi:MAG TPA: nitroreductase family protein [Streptosporangiaceae bacterium]|nr:nitroreductase family protein [Streptosporangiaceae bacterium]
MNGFETMSAEIPTATSTGEQIARFVVHAAVHAPSVHNTQPWWFYGADHEIGVHADDERRLAVADPDGREMMLSCGAALLTARVALRYIGIVPKVRVFPEAGLPTLVAKINWSDTAPPVDYERELFAEIPRRRTHRGGFDAEPLPEGILAALMDEAFKEKAALRIVGDEAQCRALAAVVEAGEYALRTNSARAREQSKWARPPGSARRDGVPTTAYPARPVRIEPNFPSRDFAHGHGWGLPPTGEDQLAWSAGVVAILTTTGDRPQDWVSAGQALQRMMLFAANCGIAVALHSQPLEVPQLRDFTKVQFCGGAHPQMVLRFGTTDQTAISVRRPVDDVLF